MKKILVIDDEQPVRKLLRRYLSSCEFEILEAPDGAAGIETLKNNSADLVITDLIMPGREGLETIAEIRKISPGMPIIAMSGGGIRLDPETFLGVAKKMGAQIGLHKPFKKDELLRVVRSLLSEKN